MEKNLPSQRSKIVSFLITWLGLGMNVSELADYNSVTSTYTWIRMPCSLFMVFIWTHCLPFLFLSLFLRSRQSKVVPTNVFVCLWRGLSSLFLSYHSSNTLTPKKSNKVSFGCARLRILLHTPMYREQPVPTINKFRLNIIRYLNMKFQWATDENRSFAHLVREFSFFRNQVFLLLRPTINKFELSPSFFSVVFCLRVYYQNNLLLLYMYHTSAPESKLSKFKDTSTNSWMWENRIENEILRDILCISSPRHWSSSHIFLFSFLENAIIYSSDGEILLHFIFS